MPSVVDDFEFIARRAGEIRSARWHELGVSPPVVSNTPQSIVPPESTEESQGSHQAAAPGTLIGETTLSDDWGCCPLPGDWQPAAGGGSNA